VQDGASQGSGRATVECAVQARNGGFDVSLNGALTGAGSVTITSSAGAGAVNAATGGTGMTGVFQSAGKGAFRSDQCTITFTYDGMPLSSSVAIQSGRIWGHLSCPGAQNLEVEMMTVDGGVAYATCDAEADFLFENCGS
jgi:hypothetical protein